MIPYSKQTIEQDDIDAVTKTLISPYLTGGPIVKEFEDKLAEYTGYKYAIAVNSGTAALRVINMALLELEKAATHIFTTPITFLATTSTMADSIGGLVRAIRFIDVDKNTLNMSIPKNAYGTLLPIDFAGLPCDEFDHYNPTLIVDSAHSLGAKLSTIPLARTFSFHPVKSITTGEGGAVVTNSTEVNASCLSLRDYGRINGDSKCVSGNYKMPAINAALGTSQLKKIDRFINRRKEIAHRYHNELPCCLRLPFWSDNHAWHLYVIRHSKRNEIREKLKEYKIESQIHYRLVYSHSSLQYLAPIEPLPNAEKATLEVLSIPIFPELTYEMQTYVINSIDKICKELKL